MQEPSIEDVRDDGRHRARKRRAKSAILSWLLFAAAGAILITIGVIYYQDRQDDDQPPIPTASAGGNQVQNVVSALESEGLDISYDVTPHTARDDDLSEVGQGLTVDDTPLYLFIYPDRELRMAESNALDPATLELANTSGTPVSTAPVRLFAGSNVIAALYGGSDDVAEKVEQAIEGLP